MFVTLKDGRLLNPETGTLLTLDRTGRVVRWSFASVLHGDDAQVVIDVVDGVLYAQETAYDLIPERPVGLADGAMIGCLEDSERGHPLPGHQVPAIPRIVH